MNEEQVFELLKSNSELSSLPQVLAEVIRVTDADDASPRDLADVIMRDPALTARLLRIVNSPLYGHTRTISTVNQAVVTLGMRAVKAVALSTGFYRMFDNRKGVMDRIHFWRHSLETAIACREIARACAYKKGEEAFILGLVHDIGLLIMEAQFPQQFKRLWGRVEDGDSLVELETKLWGTNHARVGSFLMDLWGLPDFMGKSVLLHHDSFYHTQHSNDDKLARIVCLGNLVSKFRTTHEVYIDEATMEKADYLAETLGISPLGLVELQGKVMGLLPKESEFLEIKIGSVTDLLGAANNLIYRQYFLVEKVLRDNRKMQEEIARDHMHKAALDSLKTITATLSHYLNNASAVIVGRVDLVDMAIQAGAVKDHNNVVTNCMSLVTKSVNTISTVLKELKKMSSFETTPYSDETKILDIEERLQAQIAALEKVPK